MKYKLLKNISDMDNLKKIQTETETETEIEYEYNIELKGKKERINLLLQSCLLTNAEGLKYEEEVFNNFIFINYEKPVFVSVSSELGFFTEGYIIEKNISKNNKDFLLILKNTSICQNKISQETSEDEQLLNDVNILKDIFEPYNFDITVLKLEKETYDLVSEIPIKERKRYGLK